MSKNLKKHNIKKSLPIIYCNGKGLAIDGDSCALCVLSGFTCNRCPIVKVTGKNCMESGQWDKWTNGNPHPMRKLLKKVYKELYGDNDASIS